MICVLKISVKGLRLGDHGTKLSALFGFAKSPKYKKSQNSPAALKIENSTMKGPLQDLPIQQGT